MSLARQRCFHHETREAVSRCMGCSRAYCRECVAEHDEKLYCASCLAKLKPAARARGRLPSLVGWLAPVAGFFLVWLFFQAIAQVLLLIPGAPGGDP